MYARVFLGVFLIAIVSFFIYIDTSTESDSLVAVIDVPGEYKKWNGILDTKGLENAYSLFKDFYYNRPGTQHTASHIFGELLYAKGGVQGVAVCDGTFSFGCFHGFFTAGIADVGLLLLASLDETCNGDSACQHGIGHGIAEYMRPDLLGALSACELTNQPDPLAGCTSGVFMEYNVPLVVTGTNISTEARILDEDNPYEPCTTVPNKFRTSCYYELGQWWNQVYNGDYVYMGKLCGDVEDTVFRELCFKGIGKFTPNSSEYDVALTISRCEKMSTKKGILYCKYAASWAFQTKENHARKAPLVCRGMKEEYVQHCAKSSDW